ncbi:hypothetical protein GIB67_019705 [Kingdonia uniflora]|uniref:Aminotransferase-like plant mobile domain-containing protein n=1 Tax=Kingdonia uniflora TaxID=39325 RepID=A0A7J7MJV2_9MAGN|nr:hypothetical protein GIB67_019705 [Kingdonia uniflora]
MVISLEQVGRNRHHVVALQSINRGLESYVLTPVEASDFGHYGCYEITKDEIKSTDDLKFSQQPFGKLDLGDPVYCDSIKEETLDKRLGCTISSLSWMETATCQVVERLRLLLSPTYGKLFRTCNLPLEGMDLRSRPRKNTSKTTRNFNVEVKRRGNADITNVWANQLMDGIDPTPSYDDLNRVDILPDGWIHIFVGSEEIPDSEIDIVYARAFIAYMMGNLFFSNGATSLQASYLAALIDYDILGASSFDWGMPIMAALHRGLDEVSVLRPGMVKKLITRFYAVLEYRFFEYCRVGMYLVKRYDRMEGQNQHILATMAQMTRHDSVPYDPPQEIMEFPRYDRELYQSLKDVDFYDSRDYLVPDVDYMTYWLLVHPNPKIGCSLVKRTDNIWSVGCDLVRPDVILPPTSRLTTSSQVQDYGVQATGDPCDMGWFMDVAGSNDQH